MNITISQAQGRVPVTIMHIHGDLDASSYRDLIAKGYKINFDRGAFINNHCDFVYVPEGLTKENYAKFLDTAYKQFYLRPSYIIYRLLSLRTFSEFIGHLKGFSSILFL